MDARLVLPIVFITQQTVNASVYRVTILMLDLALKLLPVLLAQTGAPSSTFVYANSLDNTSSMASASPALVTLNGTAVSVYATLAFTRLRIFALETVLKTRLGVEFRVCVIEGSSELEVSVCSVARMLNIMH